MLSCAELPCRTRRLRGLLLWVFRVSSCGLTSEVGKVCGQSVTHAAEENPHIPTIRLRVLCVLRLEVPSAKAFVLDMATSHEALTGVWSWLSLLIGGRIPSSHSEWSLLARRRSLQQICGSKCVLCLSACGAFAALSRRCRRCRRASIF